MNIVKLSETVGVAGQILPDHVADIAAAGYKVLINNRPDREEAHQPSSADIAAAAEIAGMEYYHMPVTAMDFPGGDLGQYPRELYEFVETNAWGPDGKGCHGPK